MVVRLGHTGITEAADAMFPDSLLSTAETHNYDAESGNELWLSKQNSTILREIARFVTRPNCSAEADWVRFF
jgi:hypothetical protein